MKDWMKTAVAALLAGCAGGIWCYGPQLWACLEASNPQRAEYYAKKVGLKHTRKISLPAARGKIFDCNGEELVLNVADYAVALKPHRVYPARELGRLAEILGLQPGAVQAKAQQAQKAEQPVVLRRNLTPKMLTVFEEEQRDFADALLLAAPQRYYIHDNLASHVLGTLGSLDAEDADNPLYRGLQAGDTVGKSGLEKSYDYLLRGEDGEISEVVGADGNVLSKSTVTAPRPGKNLYLTLDRHLQKKAEEFAQSTLQYLRKNGAPGAYACSVVVLDPWTGAVKALLSIPDYDPNEFARGLTREAWQRMNKNSYSVHFNRATMGEYPPGSTFKIVTGTAALESGAVRPEEKIFDPGYFPLVPSMGNAHKEKWGWLDFNRGFALSDNVYFYELGYRTGIDNISKYAYRYGLGQLTGIDIKEEGCGLVASWETRQKLGYSDWRLGDTLNAAIGQGYNLVTPLQLAVMASTVATKGYRPTPYLVEKVTEAGGQIYQLPSRKQPEKVEISAKTLDLLRKGMETVATSGTAYNFKNLVRPVAAKTGTAETSGKDHGLFVAYGPADKPELCVAAVVEHGGYGATAAAPIVYKVFEEYYRTKGYK